MVGVVGLLSLSMVVTTPATAMALTAVGPAAPPNIAGAVKTASPTIARNMVNLLPGGFAIKALRTLGMIAFATSDMWVPYVTGTFGQGTSAETWEASPVPDNYQAERQEIDTFNRSGDDFTVTYKYGPHVTQDWYARVGVLTKCKRQSDGRVGFRTMNRTVGRDNSGEPGSFSSTFTDTCPGDEIVGFILGGGQGTFLGTYSPNLDQSDPQPAMMGATTTQYDKATTNIVRWGEMSQNGPGVPGFDPNGSDVKYQGRAECIDAAGNIAWAEGSIVTGDAGGIEMPSCEKRGLGHGTGKTQVIAFKPDGTQQPVWDTPTAPSDPETPLCDPGLPTSGCVLEVTKDGQPCTTADIECQDWQGTDARDSSKTRIKCKFGPYTLPTSACGLLEQAYRIGGAPATDENTDGDPGTQNNNDFLGNPVPQPGGAPVTNGTGGLPLPGGAGQTAPTAAPDAQQCFPQGWSAFNPIEWIMNPVSCALAAAFQPKRDIQTRLTSMQAQFSTKVPITWFTGGVTNVSGGSCPTNWALDIQGQHVSLICGTPAEGIILAFRPVLGAMLIIAALWPLVRSLFYAAIPVLKVNPS